MKVPRATRHPEPSGAAPRLTLPLRKRPLAARRTNTDAVSSRPTIAASSAPGQQVPSQTRLIRWRCVKLQCFSRGTLVAERDANLKQNAQSRSLRQGSPMTANADSLADVERHQILADLQGPLEVSRVSLMIASRNVINLRDMASGYLRGCGLLHGFEAEDLTVGRRRAARRQGGCWQRPTPEDHDPDLISHRQRRALGRP